MAALKILIKGKVQGVFFRASAKKKADALHAGGWIRNTVDGDVEAFVSGSEAAVQAFANWCKTGPAGAFVADVEIIEVPDCAALSFEIRK
ncbi:MAG: acylphosphatase [Flavisolibacter sp.]|jgi:acylphosphatase|nr:acylphosphatase [Flavisolibacter sp.]